MSEKTTIVLAALETIQDLVCTTAELDPDKKQQTKEILETIYDHAYQAGYDTGYARCEKDQQRLASIGAPLI